ncbi:kelch repeat-containing protein [Gimesia aquarii]|uniref:N-acetylneuraminate epimerase n=1 Tax=Gimesia aquarii TaxID=2527964 RepID=A0A517X1S9_9PLAN|nr:kelch repeat-containing protein [Gimesia aquarii]QDU11456.1 N-acetylneuraminate epimerase precursor [Gimesia aquarii]
MRPFQWMTTVACLLALFVSNQAQAHFLWLLPQAEGKNNAAKVQLYFGEAAEPDDPDLLKRLTKIKVWEKSPNGKLQPYSLTEGDDSLFVTPNPKGAGKAAYGLDHTYGVISRGDSQFLLKYYAKAFPQKSQGVWNKISCSKELPLEIVPVLKGEEVTLQVNWNGKPLADAELKIIGPKTSSESVTATTNAEGQFQTKLSNGIYSIRAKHTEQKKGEHNGDKYDSVRHYSTLTLPYVSLSKSNKTVATKSTPAVKSKYPQLPDAISSFGAAVSGDYLYVYSGHIGRAHQHSAENLSQKFQRLNLKHPKGWESLPLKTPLQGLAMAPHGDSVYRVGGLSVTNKKKEESKMNSIPTVERYSPEKKTWESIPSMPTGRSSHDSVFLGDHLYVVGGWTMQNGIDSIWQEDMVVLDASAENPQWKAIKQPFQRRALSAAAHQGKIYVMGGIDSGGDISHEVDIYCPETGKWSKGPEIPGSTMNGFGTTAWSIDGNLYVSVMDGGVYQLDQKNQKWKKVSSLTTPRFFHRLLPDGNGGLIAIGGASRKGHLKSIEQVKLN